MEETLGFLALLVTALGLVSLAAWFFSSAVLNLASTRRVLNDEPRYGDLLKENERLRSLLAQAEEDNACLRELHGYSGRLRRVSGVARDAA
jgi:cell shape-determining protein MreC